MKQRVKLNSFWNGKKVAMTDKYLYKAGGWVSILFLIYSVATILILALLDGGYPDSALDCFKMIHANRFVALIRMDLISIIIIPLYYLLFFSIYRALKNDSELLSKIALFFNVGRRYCFCVGKWIVSYYPKVFPRGRMGKALSYTYGLFHRLSRYHLDGRYRLDNNLAENALRNLSLGRKNYMFCGNHEAAENAAVMYSLLGLLQSLRG